MTPYYLNQIINGGKMKHEITSQNTKRMLANTLISLMKKKPLSKISISEIVKDCQINRKTFYYHFEDIYDLLEWHLEQEVTPIVQTLESPDDFDTAFHISVNYMENNAYLYNCVDDPYFCDKLMDFITKILHPICVDTLTTMEKRHQKNLDPDYKQFLTEMLTKIAALSIIDNIKHKNNYDMERMLLYLSDTMNASIEGFFSKI